MCEQNETNGTVDRTTATAPRLDPARAEELVGRSLDHRRSWLAQRQVSAEVIGPAARMPTREWLVRASFCLFAMVLMGVVVFSALGLLSSRGAVVALAPVATLTALVLGNYLGDRQSS